MEKNEIEIIKKETSEKTCYICNGSGYLPHYRQCKICKGSGIFKDNHYILIVNGMAFSMDTIK